jgi:hypothetical protein
MKQDIDNATYNVIWNATRRATKDVTWYAIGDAHRIFNYKSNLNATFNVILTAQRSLKDDIQ